MAQNNVHSLGQVAGHARNVVMVEAIPAGSERDMQVPKVSIVEWFEASAVEKRKRGKALRDGTDSGKLSKGRLRSEVRMEEEEVEEGEPKKLKGKGEEKYSLPGPAKTRKPRTAKVKKSIRMMKEVKTIDIVDQFRDTSITGLN